MLHLPVGLIPKLKRFQGFGDFFFFAVSLAGREEERRQRRFLMGPKKDKTRLSITVRLSKAEVN